MNMTVVIIIFSSLLLMLVLGSAVPCIKGGSVDVKCSRWSFFSNSKDLVYGHQKIDTSDLKQFVVKGNSMSRYGIKDGMSVYVERYHEIHDYPVVAFALESDWNDAQYKLRKFVQYVEDINNAQWETIYDNNKEYMRVPKDVFVLEMNSRVDTLNKKGDTKGRFILSYTHKEKENKEHYSLHSEKGVVGIVKYYA